MILAVVGAGGKTGLIKRYAEHYRALGKKVLVTTTTHMFIEEDTLLTEDAEAIIHRLETQGYVMAGTPQENQTDTVHQSGGKIGPLPEDIYEKVCPYADVVLVEADGSRHMPIKFPNDREPVIPANADEIIVVCGLHALGRTIRDAAHRPELVKGCLGAADDTIIEAEHIQTLVRKGYMEKLRETYPDKGIRVEPNHDDSLYQRSVAGLMRGDMDVALLKKEWFRPQPTLIICGGGHVSCEIVKIGSCLDFRIKVIDDRREFACKERFPLADEVICDSFEHLEKYMEPHAYYCVVTRGHKDDLDCVSTILKHPYEYLGMIGSRGKVQQTFENLRREGVPEEKIDTIFAPIGLPIGAVTPAEIAVSILAQIIQEKNKKCSSSAARELLEVKEPGILCIIIEKTGSTPRGVGSMMFVGRDRCIGSVGGGAVEMAVIQDCRSRMEQWKLRGQKIQEPECPMIKEYQLNRSESADLGMICGGTNKILMIPV